MEKIFEYVREKYKSIEFQDYCEIPTKIKEDNLLAIDDDFGYQDFGIVYKSTNHYLVEWKSIHTDNTKECFEKNLLNPIWSVELCRQTILIEKSEDKVRIKFYTYYKYRGIGKQFYRVTTSLRFYSYNYKTNAMYEGLMNNFHKKRKFTKKVRRVGPSMNPMSGLKSLLINYISQDFDSIINNSERVDSIFNTFIKSIPGIENYKEIYPIENRIYKMYLDKQGVKLPNNWQTLVFSIPQPKLRDIKKSKFKYIDALMNLYKLKGDRVKKVLHTVDNFNPHNLKVATNIFGENFLLQQSDEFWKKLIETNAYLSDKDITNFSKKEKNNILNIFKLILDGQINSNTFDDHFRFYTQINKFEKIKWKSNDLESFGEEHLDWTEMYDFYTKGDYKRIYDEKLLEFCQEKIFDSNNNEFYPVVLKTSKEYNEESYTQSNCVKSYIQKPSSFIISLRKGSKDSKERATIEFTILMDKKTNEIMLKRVQTLGRFNSKLNDSWDIPIAVLDSKIRMCMSNFDYTLPKIEVRFGHKLIKANGIFKEKDRGTLIPAARFVAYDSGLLYLGWDNSININEYYNEPYVI